jgi:MoxR-like ATPase
VSVYHAEKQAFEFHPGPIFANVVLADEINRTTPRTQSALLEAMSDGQVSVDDTTHTLDQPFLVLATQNPAEHFGTYPLPESQMDRFLLRIQIGYPERDVERDILRRRGGADPVVAVEPVIEARALVALQEQVENVRVDDELVDYAMSVIEETRRSPLLSVGVSTRGGLSWYRAAQAYALVSGRDFCVPDDFKVLALPALAHRVMLASAQESLGRARFEAERAIREALTRVSVPA